MAEREVYVVVPCSAVGILDAQGKLIGSLSVADLRDLSTDKFGMLLKPTGELLKSTFTNATLDTIDKDASFESLLKLIVSKRLHRVYVLDAEGGPRSIITLTDVLRVVSGCSIPKVRQTLGSCLLATVFVCPVRCNSALGSNLARAHRLPLMSVIVLDKEGKRVFVRMDGMLSCLLLQARRSLDMQRSFEEKRRADALCAEYKALTGEDISSDDD